MSHAAPQPTNQPAYGVALPAAPERIGLGLAAALLAVVAGVVLSVVLWRAGFIASLSSFLVAGGAVFLYTRAAGAPPRRGLALLVVLILVGVALSFFACVASDLSQVYDQYAPADAMPKAEFIRENIVDGGVLGRYGSDIAMFAVFAALGVFGTMRRLLAAR